MIKLTPQKQTRQEQHPYHLFVGVMDAGAESNFLYFQNTMKLQFYINPREILRYRKIILMFLPAGLLLL